MTSRTPLPAKAGAGLLAGAALLIVIAAAGNIGHTYEHATRLGQHGNMARIIAVLPDIMLILSIIRLRYNIRSTPAWAGAAASAAFVGWASIATAEHGTAGKVVALAPLIAAVIATALLEGSLGGETLEQFKERTEKTITDANALLGSVRDQAATDLRNATAAAEQFAADLAEQVTAATAHATELETALATERAANRAALDAAHEAARNAAAATRAKPSGKRTAGAPKTPVRQANRPDDLHRRTEIKDRYIASVRTGSPMSNADLATELYGPNDGSETVLSRARVTASRWRKDADITAPASAAEVTV